MARAAQIYWVKRIDNSRLVRRRNPTLRGRTCASLLALAAVCLAVVLLCAWQHFRYLDTGYRLEELRAELEAAREWNRTLRLEQASLADPMRVDLLARAHLGLEAPVAGQWIPVGGENVVRAEPILARRLSVSAGQPTRMVSLAD